MPGKFRYLTVQKKIQILAGKFKNLKNKAGKLKNLKSKQIGKFK